MRTIEERGDVPISQSVRRISWAAVFAGLAVTLAVGVLLGFLGVAIGATAVNPLTQQNPMKGLGIGAAVWLFITMVLAFFAGGWVAGRLAGFPRRLDNSLHGIVTWAAATVFTVYLTGVAIGGAFNLVGKGVAAAGQGEASFGPQIREAAGAALQEGGVNWDTVKQQATTLLQQRAKDPQAAQAARPQLYAGMQKLFSGHASDADRQSLINLLTQNTTLSQQEATQTVANWERNLQQLQAQGGEQKAREVGQAAATGVASTAWVLFGIVLLGAVCAALGGSISTPRYEELRPTAA